MSLKKSILFALLIVLFCVPALWYSVILPYEKSEIFFQQAPEYVNTIIGETYPSDLEITVSNGLVSLNKPTPYCLIIDKQLKTGILFDPNFQLSMLKPEILAAYPLCTPVAIIGENTIMHADSTEQGYTVQPIPATANYVIDQKAIEGLTTSSLPTLVQWGWMLYQFAPVFLVPLVFLGVLLANIWFAFINKIVFSLLDIKEYSKFNASYAISLRFFTLLIGVYTIILFYNFYTNSNITFTFPFSSTIIITVLSLIWAKMHPANILETTIQEEKQKVIVESAEVASPKKISPEDENVILKKSDYKFDPTVISQPTKDKN